MNIKLEKEDKLQQAKPKNERSKTQKRIIGVKRRKDIEDILKEHNESIKFVIFYIP